MEDLIRQAFLHVEVIGPHVAEGHYDLVGPNNEIILPAVWETVIEPDWTVTMHMWPMPDDRPEEVLPIVEVPEVFPIPPLPEKKASKIWKEKTSINKKDNHFLRRWGETWRKNKTKEEEVIEIIDDD